MFYVSIKISNSPGKGKGVFAAQRIKRGQKIFTLGGPYVSWSEAIALNRQNHVIPVSPTLYANMELESTLNHSCKPNVGYTDNITAIAIASINPGDELTWDYSVVTVDNWTMKCKCQMPNCRKIIGNFADLPPHLQKRYKPITPPWVLAYISQNQ